MECFTIRLEKRINLNNRGIKAIGSFKIPYWIKEQPEDISQKIFFSDEAQFRREKYLRMNYEENEHPH